MSFDRNKLLAPPDLKTAEVHVEALGETLKIIAMDGHRREIYERAMVDATSTTLRATAVAVSVCDDDGNLLYNEGDVAEIGRQDYHILDQIFDAVLKLNQEKTVEELEKNFESDRADSSSSS